jgi:putative transcriptional regulator
MRASESPAFDMRERHRVKPASLAGSLLLAHPALRDPNFRRAVVLLSAHGDDGTMGVVLNRPTTKRLSDLDSSFALGALASVPVYSGGPVQPEQLVICAWRIRPDGDGFQLFFGIEPARAVELSAEEGMHLRAFLGYSGWAEGQLENELRHQTWVVSPIPSNLMSFTQDETLWRGILTDLNHEWKLLVDEPDDPSGN